jgi:hypothetical protein
MPMNSVSATLQSPGDVCRAVLQGDAALSLSLLGTFTFAFIGIEGIPPGQPAGTFLPVAVLRGDTDLVAASPIGPISGGPGLGLVMRFAARGYTAVQIRLISIASGTVVATIAPATA